MMSAPATTREAWIDAAKGIAIILVVIGHAWRGIHGAGLLSDASPELFKAIDSRIYAFHMPMFFLLSGLFIVQSLTRLSLPEYIKSRMVRLFYPLLLWTYVFAIFKLFAGDLANDPIGLSEVLASPIPGRWQFWFLWALLLLQLGLLILRPAFSSHIWRQSAAWSLLFFSVVLQFLKLPAELHYWTSNALHFLPYFALGVLLAEIGTDWLNADKYGPLWLLLFAICLASVPMLDSFDFPKLLVATFLCLSLTSTVIWAAPRFLPTAKGFAFIGEYSMIIFLSHTIFSAGLREALLGIGIENIILHMILATLAGVALPVWFKRSFTKFASPKLLGA